MSDIKDLVVGDLSPVEQRNLAQLEAWASGCTLPGGSVAQVVDEIYADQPEVGLVLTGTYVAGAGRTKQAWRAAEVTMAARYESRRIIFKAIYPSGATVAVEGDIQQVLKDGTRRGWPFAVFLTFDSSGRIIRDHTYMLPHPNQDEFEGAAKASQRRGA